MKILQACKLLVIAAFCATLFCCRLHAQADVGSLGLNYSALVRDTAGNVQPAKAVQMRFTILTGQTGTPANAPWVETQTITTDGYGFVNAVIGAGTKAGGSAATFVNVDFSQGSYWLLVEVYNTKSNAYEALAKQAMQAVPYAKIAMAAGGRNIPPGTICAFAGDVAHIPAGWALCDGSTYSSGDPTFGAINNVLGNNWGFTTLPDMQGRFLRGANHGSGADPDAATRIKINNNGAATGDNVGTLQNFAIQGHSHITAFDGSPGIFNVSVTTRVTPGTYYSSYNTTDPQTFGIAKAISAVANPRTATESRPVNVLVNYIIKL